MLMRAFIIVVHVWTFFAICHKDCSLEIGTRFSSRMKFFDYYKIE